MSFVFEFEHMKNLTTEQVQGLSAENVQMPLCMSTFYHTKMLLHPLLLLYIIFGYRGPKFFEPLDKPSAGTTLFCSS